MIPSLDLHSACFDSANCFATNEDSCEASAEKNRFETKFNRESMRDAMFQLLERVPIAPSRLLGCSRKATDKPIRARDILQQQEFLK